MLVILHGDDVVRAGREYERHRLTADPSGLSTTVLDEPKTTMSEVIAAAAALPFFAGQRCVAVRGLLWRLTRSGERGKGVAAGREAQIAELVAFCEQLPPTTTLLFWEPVTLRLPAALVKAVQAVGTIESYAAPSRLGELQTWLEGWVQEEAALQAVAMTREAAQRLAAMAVTNIRAGDSGEREQRTGSELQRLVNELAKLSAYVGPGGKIDGAAVATLALDTRTPTFELVDAVAARATPRALNLLEQALAEGHEPLALLHQIARQVSNLLRAASVGGREPAIMAALGVPDWLARKYAQQLRGLGPAGVRQAHCHLLLADQRVKTGLASGETAVRDAVMALCLARPAR